MKSIALQPTCPVALEQVCARGDMVLAPSCYAEDFADHFANAEYHGLEGVPRSTALYRALFDGVAFELVWPGCRGRSRRQSLGADRL
jgi:hypothetical protein